MNLKMMGMTLMVALVMAISNGTASALEAPHVKMPTSSHEYGGNVIAHAAVDTVVAPHAAVAKGSASKAAALRPVNTCLSSAKALWDNSPYVRIVSWTNMTVTGAFPSVARAPLNPAVNSQDGSTPFQQSFLCTQGKPNMVCDSADFGKADAWNRFYCSAAPAADPEDASTYWNAIPQNGCAIYNSHTQICHPTTQFKAQLLSANGGNVGGSVKATLIVIEWIPQPPCDPSQCG